MKINKNITSCHNTHDDSCHNTHGLQHQCSGHPDDMLGPHEACLRGLPTSVK